MNIRKEILSKRVPSPEHDNTLLIYTELFMSLIRFLGRTTPIEKT